MISTNIYQKSLRRLGIALIVLTVIEMALAGAAYVFVGDTVDPALGMEALFLVFPQYLVEIIAGIVVLVFYRRTRAIRAFYRIEFALLCLLLALKTVTMLVDRSDLFIDAQLFFICLNLYSIRQLGMDERNRKRIRHSTPNVLDLKLKGGEQWHNPLIIGPSLRLNREIADAIDDFLEAQAAPAPLEINVHGLGEVSEAVRDTMRDVLREHYEKEMKRVEYYLESRYQRTLLLIAVSIVVMEIWMKSSGARDTSIIKIVMSNVGAFSLWQIGTVYFERKDAQERLLRATIAKEASVTFL